MIISKDGLCVQRCYDCDISASRRSIVNGFGTVDTGGLMFISESPSLKDDNYGIPLIGKVGEVFNFYLYDVGLNRDIVYVTNGVKCHTRNRSPFPHEVDNCLPMLKSELKTLKPSIVVLLGTIATRTYFQNNNLDVRDVRNKVLIVNNRVVLSIYSPGFIMANLDNKQILQDYHKQFRNIARIYQILIDPLHLLKY